MASMTIKDLFQAAGYDYKAMRVNEFYDVSEKGIKVRSRNHDTNENEYRLVKGLVYKGRHKVYKAIDTNGVTLLKGSHAHFVWDESRGDYVPFDEVETVTLCNDLRDTYEARVVATDEEDDILDIEVEGNHNYYTNNVESKNTGGYSLPFYSSFRGRVTKLDALKEKDETIGQTIRVRNYKSKIGIPFRDAVMNLYFKGGFKADEEYLSFLIDLEVVKAKGAWIDAPEWGIHVNGRAKLQEWLQEHPDKYEQMKRKVDELLLNETKLDANNVDPESEEGKILDRLEVSKSETDLEGPPLEEDDAPPDLSDL